MVKRGQASSLADGAILHHAGLRSTRPRREVLSVLLREERPLSHPQLADHCPGLDRATVYRTLLALHRAGLVHDVKGTDGVRRFCAHPQDVPHCPGNHPHFLCRVCKQMLCLPDYPLPWVKVPEGTLVEGKQLLVFGVCSSCAGRGDG